MDDLENTKLCAEAMAIKVSRLEDGSLLIDPLTKGLGDFFDPLHDDAQAMALVKKFRLWLQWIENEAIAEFWPDNEDAPCVRAHAVDDLNRAIVERVAKMQASNATA